MDISTEVRAGRHVLITGAAASGKTRTLANVIGELVPAVLRPRQVAAHAVTRSSVAALAAAVDERVEVSTVRHAAWSATSDRSIVRADRRDVIPHQRAFVANYVDLIKQAERCNGENYIERQFLSHARRQVGAALRLEARARYAGEDLLDLVGPEMPGGFLLEVADRYGAFKEARGLYDQVDLVQSAQPDLEVRLVVLDDAEDLSQVDLDLIGRLYPAATLLAAGNPALAIRCWEPLIKLEELPHDLSLELEPVEGLEPWIIESATPESTLVPPDLSPDLLIILGKRDPRAFRRWILWCMEAGLPFRVDDSPVLDVRLRDICALWLCDQGEEVLPTRLDGLARALGEPEGANICAADFPTWSNWHEMARQAYPEAAVAYAEALLARYGTLDLAEIAQRPMPRITSVARCKGLSAAVAIVDGFSMRPVQGEGPDVTNARWVLACSRARERLVVLQSETNPKQRYPNRRHT